MSHISHNPHPLLPSNQKGFIASCLQMEISRINRALKAYKAVKYDPLVVHNGYVFITDLLFFLDSTWIVSVGKYIRVWKLVLYRWWFVLCSLVDKNILDVEKLLVLLTCPRVDISSIKDLIKLYNIFSVRLRCI